MMAVGVGLFTLHSHAGCRCGSVYTVPVTLMQTVGKDLFTLCLSLMLAEARVCLHCACHSHPDIPTVSLGDVHVSLTKTVPESDVIRTGAGQL